MGIFIGGSIPFLVSSITMTAVGDAAFEMIEEIREDSSERSLDYWMALQDQITQSAWILLQRLL